MKLIANEMRYQVPGCFLRLNIFLSAMMTETVNKFCAAVEADFFFSFFQMRQAGRF